VELHQQITSQLLLVNKLGVARADEIGEQGLQHLLITMILSYQGGKKQNKTKQNKTKQNKNNKKQIENC